MSVKYKYMFVLDIISDVHSLVVQVVYVENKVTIRFRRLKRLNWGAWCLFYHLEADFLILNFWHNLSFLVVLDFKWVECK